MKKTLKLLFLTYLIIATAGCNEANANTLIKIPGKPKEGFNYPYYLFIPTDTEKEIPLYLLVEPNNTGTVSDNFKVHDDDAKREAGHSSIGVRIAKRLKIPFLKPVFPRPKSNWRTYTHALDRDSMMIKEGPLKRLDLQFISMIKNAKKELKKRKIVIKEKIFLNGFSASGTFANRFTMLHPKIVKATASGGLNGFLILPIEKINNQRLMYPIGIADYEQITGRKFYLVNYREVAQFLYMGEKDDNDATLFSDGYENVEREIIHKCLGKKMMPDRWEACQKIYKNKNINVRFVTYKDIGHGTTEKVREEIYHFFKSNMIQKSGNQKKGN
ncbi:hypothetical protein ACFLRB_01035 [Acidobacteriota bacterium]